MQKLLAAVVIGVLLGCGSTWWIKSAHIDKLKSQYTLDTVNAKASAEKDLEAADRKIKTAEQNYLINMGAKQNEIDLLRSGVESGSISLSIDATCPIVPSASGSSGNTETTRAELGPLSRQDYYALKADLAEAEERIELCQAFALEISEYRQTILAKTYPK